MTDKKGKPRGNPNPSPATRFGAGNNANPAGKTSEQKRLEYENAEAAMRIRQRILAAVERQFSKEGMSQDDADNRAMEMVEAAMLKLLKDSEDRGLGSPVQDVRSGDGSMSPKTGIDLTKAPPEFLEWLVSQNDEADKQ